MSIQPDTKDWTWVLREPCPECRFDAATVAPEEVGGMLRAHADAWRAVLGRARAEVTARPTDDRWSALEYACHVRDLLRLADERVRMMLTEDEPDFANWDQDETALAGRYGEQEPADVGPELARAAEAVADRFAGVSGDGWARTGNRSDGSQFTVASFALYLVHDPIHHLVDVEEGFARLAQAGPPQP
jgi:hypothetical protein